MKYNRILFAIAFVSTFLLVDGIIRLLGNSTALLGNPLVFLMRSAGCATPSCSVNFSIGKLLFDVGFWGLIGFGISLLIFRARKNQTPSGQG